jgi:hypothetical protein
MCLSRECADGTVSSSVDVVHWGGVSAVRRGRPCRIDSAALRVIWPTSASVPERVYDAATVVHPKIGVVLQRSVAEPCFVPDRFRPLIEMWNVAVVCRSSLAPSCLACCGDDRTEPVKICALCLLEFHDSCCSALREEFPHLVVRPGLEGDHSAILPQEFDDALCILCRSVVQKRD